jgi:hypothetical protein
MGVQVCNGSTTYFCMVDPLVTHSFPCRLQIRINLILCRVFIGWQLNFAWMTQWWLTYFPADYQVSASSFFICFQWVINSIFLGWWTGDTLIDLQTTNYQQLHDSPVVYGSWVTNLWPVPLLSMVLNKTIQLSMFSAHWHCPSILCCSQHTRSSFFGSVSQVQHAILLLLVVVVVHLNLMICYAAMI